MYKQFDREGHTDIISPDLRTTFHIYQIFGTKSWRIELSKFEWLGKGDNEIHKVFVGFKTPESAMDFVKKLIHPEQIRVMDVKRE